jgi:hypothetical protein
MNDYINHKWRQFVNEDKKPARRNVLRENKREPSVQTDVIKLPKLRLSDNWGKPGNEDRKVVERVLRNIGKRGSDPWERIAAVNDFITSCDESCRTGLDASAIITNLMFLDIFHALAYEFNPATGGFLFESFLTTLFGGESAMIPTGSKTIADIYDNNDDPVSLKFFDGGKITDALGKRKKVGSQYVGGSLYDLIRSIKPGHPMTYILVRKMKSAEDVVDEILFYKFTVGTVEGIERGRIDDPNRPRIRSEHVEGDYMIGRDSDVESSDYAAVGDDPNPKDKKGKAKGKLISGNEFKITVPTIMKYAEPIAKLKFGGSKYLKNIAKDYTKLLSRDVTLAFNALNALTKNLTVYYADDPGKGAAIQNAEKNVKDLRTSVSGIKKGGERSSS